MTLVTAQMSVSLDGFYAGRCEPTLENWIESHRKYFVAEGERIGVPFTDDALVFHEYFRVLRVLQR